ncbi:MAG: hypothetical protein HY983_04035 [Candidatus Magasanikbacteria bacterium]|nr:hypothetical protein [Candidatus Magasanikbacteria bacterium]
MALKPPPQRQPQPKNNPTAGKGNGRRWWFVLGREPLLSAAEIAAVFPMAKIIYTPPILMATADFDPKQTIQQLGGTVKIAEEMGSGLVEADLLDQMAEELGRVEGKIHFGVSFYGTKNGVSQAEKWGLALKKRLKANGKSVRYVDNRGVATLSSATVLHNGLAERGREFIIVPTGDKKYALAKTVAIQPLEAFSERDFGRPGRDDASGLLPPKLAMMMINCAGVPKNKILYDPSCGSGTILTEAMLLGYTQLFGSDISAKAVEDTKKNFAWMQNKAGATQPRVTIFEYDIQKPPTQLDLQQLGGIVSEPFMGPPLKGRETLQQLQQTARELATLYLATFRSLASFLPKGAPVVYIFPRFSGVRTAELVLPKIKKMDFKVVPLLPAEFSPEPFALYQRPDQRVGREIWKFSFEKATR